VQLFFTGAKLYSIFVLKFVAMATKVVRGKIQMTSSNSTGTKIWG